MLDELMLEKLVNFPHFFNIFSFSSISHLSAFFVLAIATTHINASAAHDKKKKASQAVNHRGAHAFWLKESRFFFLIPFILFFF